MWRLRDGGGLLTILWVRGEAHVLVEPPIVEGPVLERDHWAVVAVESGIGLHADVESVHGGMVDGQMTEYGGWQEAQSGRRDEELSDHSGCANWFGTALKAWIG